MSRLKCLNAISTLECTRLDLLLPLSLTGHDALVKIYVFMQSKSQIVYQAISSFIWNKGPIRIWNALWEMSKASGIILLGNKYVHGILHWPRCHYNIERLPIWVQLEETWCRAMPLMKLACALLSKSSFNLNHSPAVSQILWIWRRHSGIQAISILSPSVSSVSEWQCLSDVA